MVSTGNLLSFAEPIRYSSGMLCPETSLEQTQRHVTEGQARLARQEALVARLRQEDHLELLSAAQGLLAQMHEFQELGQEHLEREQAKVAS